MTHIFAGAYTVRDNDKKLAAIQHWKTEWSDSYFDLMEDYKDTIIIEIAGHDHWADLRAIED